MPYKGYKDKDARRRYLVDYMRNYRERQRPYTKISKIDLATLREKAEKYDLLFGDD